MGPIRGKGGWGVRVVLGGPKHVWPLLQHFNYIVRILSSSSVDWHPFWANWVEDGGLWTCPKDRGTRARVQAAGWVKPMKQQFTLNPKPFKLPGLCQHEIVSGILKKRSNEEPCKPVPGESFGHGRPYLSICPIPLRHFKFRSWEYVDGRLFEKGADWYPFCVGGGTGRGG